MYKPLGSPEFTGSLLVGVASTLYRDKADPRFELALTNAENWRDAGLPYVVVDASTEPWVRKAHEARGADVVDSKIGGIATQRQQGIAFAMQHGAEKAVGHEPEKIEMAKFSAEIARGLDEHAILVIGRTAAAEVSLPPTQRYTERMAGWILQQSHDLPADTLSGGRGFNRAGAEVLAEYPSLEPGMNNWIYLYKTLIDARNKGLSVGGTTVDLMHPASMVKEEEGNPIFDRKRYDQFKLQLDYMLNRSDVALEALPAIQATLAALEGITKDTPNEEFAHQLDRLEQRLFALGYTR